MQTATQQRNSFSEGLALGLILKGYREIRYDKPALDSAVSRAFRGWAHSSLFPQVATDLKKGLDGSHALIRADERKHTAAFYWDASGPMLRIVDRQSDWSEDDPDDIAYALEVIGGGIPSEGWKNLAVVVLTHLRR